MFCGDHEDPLTHDCPALEDVLAEDTFDQTTEPRSRSLAREATVWGAVVLATVLSLALVGVATGVFTPAAIVDTSPEPTDPPATGAAPDPDSAEAEPDPAAVRTALLDRLNAWRVENGHDRLAPAPDRRTVLDRLAADLASEHYFSSSDVQDDPRFSPKHRLGENGFGCLNHTRGFAAIPPREDRRTGAELGRYAAETLLEDLQSTYSYRQATIHDVGVHVTERGTVYVAYVAC